LKGPAARPAAALVLAASLLPLPACREAAVPSLIRVAHESDMTSLDPTSVNDSASHSILSNIYEPLVAFDHDMALQPALAVSWSNVDEKTLLIQLRRGVRFHDGTSLKADQVKRTLERARSAGAVTRRHLATIDEVEVVDDHTLRLTTLRRDPLLINRLTYVLIARESRSSELVGTGPYRLVRWEKGRVLEAEAFAGYRAGRPATDRVRFVPVQQGPRSIEVLRQGEVEVLRFVPETLVDRLQSVPGVRVVSRPGTSNCYLWLNTAGKGTGQIPFADRRVRQAVSLAIDRKAIIERLGGHGIPLHQLVPRGIYGHVASLPELSFDPQESRRLLGLAGYAKGFDATLSHRPQAPTRTVAKAIQGMLVEVGIRLRLETPDWHYIVAEWSAARLPFFLAGWRFENGDAHSFLVDCVMTRDPIRNLGSDNPGFSSPTLDRLIEKQAQILDERDRLSHYETLMRVAMDEMPLVPLYTRNNLYGVSQGVQWEPRLDGKLLVAEMSLEQ